ncbi:MAG: type VI secretion system membrane subunit TssM [Methylotenera sp.]|nr:type VI secretion system membrane subunit TssM [Methylotenera sp.]
MKKLLSFLLHPITLGVFFLLVVSALVWWVGPLIAFGEHRPLDTALARGLALAVVWVLGLLRLVWALLRRRRLNAALVKGMATGPSAAAQEEAVLQERFSQAIALLKQAPGAKKGLLGSGSSLYELPWYVFIGAPGAGKTTALLNAGINFPLTEKLGQASVRGVGGTRNCEWWFSDEAVLIDTAGRYATQDSDKDTDAAAWDTFLGLLRRARPRRPINGVLLTVSVQDLLALPPDQRKEQAARLRGRMQELQQRLGVKVPVYVLVTKCDLLAGFNETFGSLGKEERDQVLGFTFPLSTQPGEEVMANFGSEFASLEKRLRERLIERMEAESDPLKRAVVFAFPQQFGGLRGLLGSYLETVFGSGGTLDEAPRLRGVYFTSGTQEGTPIDRVLGALARTFGVERRLTPPAAAKGRSYFLNHLLRRVVFVEQYLVGQNAEVERRSARLRLAGLAALSLATLTLLIGWGFSYLGNQRYIADIEAKLPALKDTVAALPPTSGSDPSALPEALAALRDAAQPPGFALDHPPLSLGFGLFQGDKLDAGAQVSYHRLLQRALAPRVAARLEERLRTANRDNLEFAYESLKAYLMLYNPEHLDKPGLQAWVGLDWDANLEGSLGPEKVALLKNHLDALLSRGGFELAQPIDKTLVASVREMLGAYPLEYRIFSRLRRAQIGGDLPPFTVAAAAGPQSPNVFERASGQPLTQGIPGMFTKDGYKKAFQTSVDKTARQLAEEEAWVLGTNPAIAKRQAADKTLVERVRRLYLEEYVKVWDAYLADVRLVKLAGLDRGIAVSRLLSAVDSPLAAFLRAASKETTLIDPVDSSNPVDKEISKRGDAVLAKGGELARLAGNQAKAPASVSRDGPLEKIVDDHSAGLRRLVTGTPPPLDDVMKMFNEVYVQLSAVQEALKSKSPPPAGGGGAKLKAAAGQQPEPLRTALETLADAADNQSRLVERQSLTGELQPVAEFCARAIAGRYPVAQGAKVDVLPEDFGQFFAPGGMMDDFFTRKLNALVDVGTNPWSFRPTGDGTRPVSPAALADFQRASRVREVFFRNGGKTPAFRVDVRALELGDGLKELTLDIDGQVSRFTAGNTAPVSLQWPGARLSSQIRLTGQPGGTPITFDGPWALFRLFDRFEVQGSPQQPERFIVVMNLDGHRARLEVTASSVFNPFRLRELQQFRCPGAL